jgi:hypothetical protein
LEENQKSKNSPTWKNTAATLLIFTGIPKNCGIEVIYSYFRQFGMIEKLKLNNFCNNKEHYGCTMRHTGMGIVKFYTSKTLEMVMGKIDINYG